MRMRSAALAGAMFAAFVIGFGTLDPAAPRAAIAGDSQDVESLVARLVGDDAKASAEAADALVALGVAVIPRLSATSEPIAARAVMLETLGRIGADHDEAVAPLAAALTDNDAAIRAAAALGLAAAGPRAKSAGPALKGLLTDRDGRVRASAAAAMLASGYSGVKGPAWPVIAAAAGDADPAVRRASVRAAVLARVQPDLLVPALVTAARDADRSVRIASLRAIGAAGLRDARFFDVIAACARSRDAEESALAIDLVPRFTDKALLDVIRFGAPFRGDRVERTEARTEAHTDVNAARAILAVSDALGWLARHQADDGHWGAEDFDKCCKLNRCDSPGYPQFDVGVTGLALLCFLGAGETHLAGPHKETVAKGLAFLRRAAAADGYLRGPADGEQYEHFSASRGSIPIPIDPARAEPAPAEKPESRFTSGSIYNHAVATVALCDAYLLTRDPELGAAAKRAVACSLRVRNAYQGWHDADADDGPSDASLTGWMAWALLEARATGLDVKGLDEAVTDSVAWLKSLTNPGTGRTGYDRLNGLPARTATMFTKFPPDKSEAPTAIGVFVRSAAGEAVTDSLAPCVDLVAKRPPHWDIDAGTIDLYYWFWGSMAMRRVGGERWATWSVALRKALLANQREVPDRDERGSWDPVDAWSEVGGRVYSTAMCCLALESYWRMDPYGGK